jgi:hypothetical protein
MMKYVILFVALACLPLGGCGALAVGAVGGAVAGAVISNNRPPPPVVVYPPPPPR